MRGLVHTLMLADKEDREAGRMAYPSYRAIMADAADLSGHPIERVTAAFVALSPNSDYLGNLRSLVSVINGVNQHPVEDRGRITVSTYKHCRDRAIRFLTGEGHFLNETSGPKTRAFYHNILNPNGREHATIDGHMWCIWTGQDVPMKGVRMSKSQYREIERDIIHLAQVCGMWPAQLQATLWFTRKRVKNILFDPQLDFFHDPWRVRHDIRDIRPYPMAAA